MSSFGVTATGFAIKTVQDLLDDIEAGEQSAFGTEINLAADSVFGQLNGVVAGALSEAWELGEAVYSAQYPNSANDAALDNVAAITGVVRLAATQSTAELYATGTAGTVLTAGRVVSHVTSGVRFNTDAIATLVAVTAWAGTTVYVAGTLASNSGNVYVCTVGGTSAGAGGPSGEGGAIVDGSVTWAFVGNGTGGAAVAATAELFGPTAAPAGSLSEIDTPVAGWQSITNLLDATLGTNIETDPELRVRRKELLAAQGAATIEAIRSNVLGTTGVVSVLVFENASEFTDADGRPPHSIEVVVLTTTGDTPDAVIDQAVADAVFAAKAAGIETFGFPGRIVTKTVVDSTGNSHTINWSRVEEVEIYVDTTIVVNNIASDGPTYPLDGDDQVKQALTDNGNTLVAGQDVVAEFIKCQSFEVAGVVDITGFGIDVTPAPVATANIAISQRQIAVFDTSRVTVTSS